MVSWRAGRRAIRYPERMKRTHQAPRQTLWRLLMSIAVAGQALDNLNWNSFHREITKWNFDGRSLGGETFLEVLNPSIKRTPKHQHHRLLPYTLSSIQVNYIVNRQVNEIHKNVIFVLKGRHNNVEAERRTWRTSRRTGKCPRPVSLAVPPRLVFDWGKSCGKLWNCFFAYRKIRHFIAIFLDLNKRYWRLSVSFLPLIYPHPHCCLVQPTSGRFTRYGDDD